jgi:Catalase
VIGRFSLGGGQPYAADKPDAVRGLGLEFSPPDGELWRTAMINLPVFPVRTPEAFYEQLLASKPDPNTGKPDPAKMKAFLERHPETVQALTVIKGQPVSSGFGDSTFHSLNAFRFHQCGGRFHPGALDLDADPAVRGGKRRSGARGQELSLRRTDRTNSPPAVAMASHRHRWTTGRSDQRRHPCLAGGAGGRWMWGP